MVVAHLSEFVSGPKRWDPCFFTNNETLCFFWNTKNPFCWAPETASEEDRGLSNLAGRWKGRLPSRYPPHWPTQDGLNICKSGYLSPLLKGNYTGHIMVTTMGNKKGESFLYFFTWTLRTWPLKSIDFEDPNPCYRGSFTLPLEGPRILREVNFIIHHRRVTGLVPNSCQLLS